MGVQILFAFLILFNICCKEKNEKAIKDNVTLSHYQRLTICPELYRAYIYRDVFEGAIDFNFIKYRIPFIKNGTIRIEEMSTSNNLLVKTLQFEDSLLTNIIGGGRSIHLTYDDNKNLISDGNTEYRYTNGRLTSKESDLSIHTFDWKDKCVIWKVTDKNSSYTNDSEICYNENNKIIKDFSSFALGEKSITEEFNIQYSLDTIISQNYVRTENKDTTIHHIVSNEINSLGLLGKLSTEVVNENRTFEQEYKYEISNNKPLIVSKFKFEDGQKKNEIRYIFNDKNQLIEFDQVGKYGEKYKVIYNEK